MQRHNLNIDASRLPSKGKMSHRWQCPCSSNLFQMFLGYPKMACGIGNDQASKPEESEQAFGEQQWGFCVESILDLGAQPIATVPR